ncbi:2,3-dihydro-2,3-dihydroxybenzoate dehydrogenase [Melghirimyces algeriensis]|uniref:2,3-dihydro-2,3-dihydroxybenzoate dehydrogenase n=1 Tax=Melghirimyces algeriensis TaxID=910412 RepID=A0A521EW20_9BACL|nr:2,3-dihydro-2,3-dihydroxybenzoate dehydrogenase [Melghirimyces algeriensis]SMO88126.1 2,3-dihydro-2,3-dihydroxybenzoate dehydrogenase [Melghirimyces algeriensis]
MGHLHIEGKVALVTGAAQGIGKEVMRSLAEHGVCVAGVDKNAEKLMKCVFELKEEGYDVHAFHADVRNSNAVNDVIERIEEICGAIDILVNVAGILRTGPIESFTNEDWEETFSVNTAGVFHVSRAVSRLMIPRQSGAIVTVSSNAADVPRMFMSAYAASKAASTMFTKCLALELAPHHIRCNIVSPGSTDTEMQTAMWADEDGANKVIAGTLEEYRLGIPLQKIAKPCDIADAVLFLVSEQSRHVTMHDLRVDGGATLGA